MKPGYKQTEVGVIPEDWQVAALGDIGQCLIGLTYKPSNVRQHGVLVLRSSNIQEGALAFDDNVYVDVDIPERIRVKDGDILVCVRNGSRALIGKCALLDRRVVGQTFGAFMSVYRTPDSPFVFQQFQSNLIKRQVSEHIGATINQITNANLNAFKIPLPSNREEQRAIATTLSDVDALISSLDQLIAKKRDIKQATMQQLLTGKQRLPGFSGEWEVKCFGELASPRRERIDPKRTGTHDFCVELEHIESGTGKLAGHGATSDESSLKTVFRKGDVLFGKLRAYLRKYWLADRPGVCSTEIWALAANERLVRPEYLLQLVKVDRFIDVASTAYGTHMPRSDWNVVRSFEVALPKEEEQTAIASVLSDMDAQIAVLEQKRDKTLALKQGMMQVLLTGRIRLV